MRKQPWKIALMLGPVMLALYVFKRLSLDAMMIALGQQAGARAVAVRSSYGLAAVDVDKPSDLDLVRSLVDDAQIPAQPSHRPATV